ncbi:hypothetical protein AAA799E16_00627 [Marine Group I thaumarchaeote SCGC AAA799-E16]|uniref:DUF3179 domain-containing protein n=4 Tax=Marine Group I TaxID=905826 RepID=A0A081RPD9_9ARCH|nr:hypothetical protein AAA799N04_00460 [Marine Group I thaumarchaeote SCGC AAA799-N04]KER06568.1 hypothetical protein AAA799E16_00627 [Marine Group I thaumarchaeote SCGC AAA799-E16]KFM16118.1 hypothetical protein AAA799D11_00917 [Marine Group I thaumarchaeote SCGC AAA799-D11]KFM17855.1 hypothetical protein SCCGRSA3_01795 [Marine Group I thaumarchaeote SCGC RSA3]
MNVKILAPAIAIGIALVGLALFLYEDSQPYVTITPTSSSVTIPETGISELQMMETDGIKHLIPLDKIKGGGPPKDGIPSIDDPVFATISDSQFMSDSDTVIGLEINGEAKAYPLFILVWHEIVNDKVGDVPVSVTYCPLCYTNQVFERIINGQEVEFGTSGKLYNSNLLMYDRLTESYWSQALGIAVKGELTGYQLNLVPFDVITWGDWKALHPDTLVLTTDTGHLRSYATDPYGNYYTEPRIMFPVEHSDDRMHPKEIIIGFNQDDVSKAFKQSDIESEIVINDSVGTIPVMLISLYSENSRAFERTIDGNVLDFQYLDGKIIDLQSNSEWNYDGLAISGQYEGKQLERLPIEPGFWFEWVAFHPQTLVYGDV